MPAVVRRRWLVFAICAAFLGASGEAWCADPAAAEAKKHFLEGKRLRDDGDCTKAIPEFEKSLAADKSIGAYYNLGFCQEQLGHRQEAYDAYTRGRDLSRSKQDDRAKEISGALAALMETPNIRLVLPQPLPEGFLLYVDGDLIPPIPNQTEMVIFTKAAPTHEVKATATGFDPWTAIVDNKTLKAVELKTAAPATPPPPPPVIPPKTHKSDLQYASLGVAGVGLVSFVIGSTVLISYFVAVSNHNSDLNGARQLCNGLGDSVCAAQKTPAGMNIAEIVHENNGTEQRFGGNKYLVMALMGGGGALAVAGALGYVFLPPVVEAPTDAAPPRPKSATKSGVPRLAVAAPVITSDYRGLALGGTF
jgi:hypothetical protein